MMISSLLLRSAGETVIRTEGNTMSLLTRLGDFLLSVCCWFVAIRPYKLRSARLSNVMSLLRKAARYRTMPIVGSIATVATRIGLQRLHDRTDKWALEFMSAEEQTRILFQLIEIERFVQQHFPFLCSKTFIGVFDERQLCMLRRAAFWPRNDHMKSIRRISLRLPHEQMRKLWRCEAWLPHCKELFKNGTELRREWPHLRRMLREVWADAPDAWTQTKVLLETAHQEALDERHHEQLPFDEGLASTDELTIFHKPLKQMQDDASPQRHLRHVYHLRWLRAA